APRLEDPAPWLVGPVTTAVWTGDRLLMWAERSSGFGLTGAAYDPGTRTWSSIASYSHCATQACNSLPQTAPQNGVWTGSLLIDVNGFPGAVAYDPARNSWRVLRTRYFGGEA